MILAGAVTAAFSGGDLDAESVRTVKLQAWTVNAQRY